MFPGLEPRETRGTRRAPHPKLALSLPKGFFCLGGNFAHKREMYDVHDRVSCDVSH